jgi:hypothetical protein
MTSRPLTGVVVRTARTADLEQLGRLGALLVQEHHDFDSRTLHRREEPHAG